MKRIFEILGNYGIFDAAPLALAATVIYAVIRAVYLRAAKRPCAGVCAEMARGLLVWYMVSLVVVVWLPDLPKLVFGDISPAEFSERTFFRGEYTSNDRFWKLLCGRFYVLHDFELLANIALFVPYGILLPTAFRGLKWWAADLIALGTTLVIELVQPFFGRSCDLDDIIANTLGAVLGCAAAKLVIAIVSKASLAAHGDIENRDKPRR